jgi:hypothetical protein
MTVTPKGSIVRTGEVLLDHEMDGLLTDSPPCEVRRQLESVHQIAHRSELLPAGAVMHTDGRPDAVRATCRNDCSA